MDEAQCLRLRPMLEDACAFVFSHRKIDDPSEEQERRLELLAAVYALKTYYSCAEQSVSSFTAGDVKFTSSAEADGRWEKLWRQLCGENRDIIDSGNFIFGRV